MEGCDMHYNTSFILSWSPIAKTTSSELTSKTTCCRIPRRASYMIFVLARTEAT